MLDVTVPLLPADRPRYLMGVGTPDDLIGAVQRGIDMFDCVMPTRAGRTGRAYTTRGMFNLRNARFADDAGAAGSRLRCPACTRHTRAYLHHLFQAGEMLGPMLLTWHNLTYYQALMRGMRGAIVAGRLRRLSPHRVRAAWRAPGDDGRRRRTSMTEDAYAGLTQLGHAAQIPASPDEAALERVPNPHAGQALRRALHLPGIHLALPADRPAGFRPHRHRLHPARLDRREQVAEAVPDQFPQPWRIP